MEKEGEAFHVDVHGLLVTPSTARAVPVIRTNNPPFGVAVAILAALLAVAATFAIKKHRIANREPLVPPPS